MPGTECSEELFEFPARKRRTVEANFQGGEITSDGGASCCRARWIVILDEAPHPLSHNRFEPSNGELHLLMQNAGQVDVREPGVENRDREQVS